MNGYHEFLRSRRSVRRFRPDPVPAQVLERILESACYAPSAHNRQPWRFALLETMQARINLVQAMSAEFEKDLTADGLEVDEINQRLTRSRDRILQAPAAIVLCYHPGDMDSYADSRRQHFEDLMGIQSTALAGGTLLLAAHAEGLGGVWMCAPIFAAEAVRGSLGLPPEWQPQALLLLGYPARQPETPSRVAMNSIIYRINP